MSVQEIADAIRKHNEENPNHGAACVCMDVFVRALREILSPLASRHLWTGTEDEFNVAHRFDYVVIQATRSLSNL